MSSIDIIVIILFIIIIGVIIWLNISNSELFSNVTKSKTDIIYSNNNNSNNQIFNTNNQLLNFKNEINNNKNSDDVAFTQLKELNQLKVGRNKNSEVNQSKISRNDDQEANEIKDPVLYFNKIMNNLPTNNDHKFSGYNDTNLMKYGNMDNIGQISLIKTIAHPVAILS